MSWSRDLERLGKHLERDRRLIDELLAATAPIVRASVAADIPKLRIAKLTAVSRPTLDRWIEDGSVNDPPPPANLERELTRLGKRLQQLRTATSETLAAIESIVREAAAAGTSKTQIAELSHVSRPTIDQWLKNQASPRDYRYVLQTTTEEVLSIEASSAAAAAVLARSIAADGLDPAEARVTVTEQKPARRKIRKDLP